MTVHSADELHHSILIPWVSAVRVLVKLPRVVRLWDFDRLQGPGIENARPNASMEARPCFDQSEGTLEAWPMSLQALHSVLALPLHGGLYTPRPRPSSSMPQSQLFLRPRLQNNKPCFAAVKSLERKAPALNPTV